MDQLFINNSGHSTTYGLLTAINYYIAEDGCTLQFLRLSIRWMRIHFLLNAFSLFILFVYDLINRLPVGQLLLFSTVGTFTIFKHRERAAGSYFNHRISLISLFNSSLSNSS